MTWLVYILECAGGRLYTGVTTDMDRRLAEHCSGKGARFTRAFVPRRVVYLEKVRSRGAALSREAAIKKLSRPEKQFLLKNR